MLATWREVSIHDFLMKILKKTPIFKRAKHNEMKACAAHTLGLIGSRDALSALEKMRKSGNKFLSEYAYAAMKRIEHGRQ